MKTEPARDEALGPPRTLRDQQRDLTRRRILDTAHRAFTEIGVANATLDQIARDAGISRATLYLHFPNKEAILVDLLRRDLRSVRAVFQSLPEAVRGGHDTTMTWLLGHADQISRHAAHLKLFSIAIASDPAAVQLVREHRVAEAMMLIKGIGAPIDPVDRALLTRVILMIARIDYLVSALARADTGLDAEAALEMVTAEILVTLGGPPAP